MRRTRRNGISGWALAAVLGLACAAQAATVHFDETFESRSTGAVAANTGWQMPTDTAYSFTVVDTVTAPTGGGSKVGLMQRVTGATSASYTAVMNPAISLTVGQRVTLSTNVRYVAGSKGLILSFSDMNSYNNQAAYISINSAGILTYRSYSGTTPTSMPGNLTLAADTWYRIDVTVDVTAGGISYDLVVTPDGGTANTIATDVPVHSQVQAGDNLRAIFSPQGAASGTYTTAIYLDNVRVETAPIPEPAAAAMGTLGAAMILMRRRG